MLSFLFKVHKNDARIIRRPFEGDTNRYGIEVEMKYLNLAFMELVTRAKEVGLCYIKYNNNLSLFLSVSCARACIAPFPVSPAYIKIYSHSGICYS